MATLDHRPVLEDGRHLDGFKTDVQGRKGPSGSRESDEGPECSDRRSLDSAVAVIRSRSACTSKEISSSTVVAREASFRPGEYRQITFGSPWQADRPT